MNSNKKKEIKQEVEQVKEVKQIVRNTKIAGITNNRKEVLGMGLEQEQLKQNLFMRSLDKIQMFMKNLNKVVQLETYSLNLSTD